ncbi:MAG TPA: hypothetical protein VFE51_31195 [Verrucomicrobiae bacterium]|nr:hypothetical protein [Verrucomicrobiae bacterium]
MPQRPAGHPRMKENCCAGGPAQQRTSVNLDRAETRFAKRYPSRPSHGTRTHVTSNTTINRDQKVILTKKLKISLKDHFYNLSGYLAVTCTSINASAALEQRLNALFF